MILKHILAIHHDACFYFQALLNLEHDIKLHNYIYQNQ